MSSDDSGLSSGAEDGGKNEAASEEEDEARSEGAESDGAESEGDDTRRKEKVIKLKYSLKHNIFQCVLTNEIDCTLMFALPRKENAAC